MRTDEGSSFLDSSSSWERGGMMEAAVFSPAEVQTNTDTPHTCPGVPQSVFNIYLSQVFSLSAADELKLQRPALTSTPLCSVKHAEVSRQNVCCIHCSLSSRCVSHLSHLHL